MIKKTVLFLMFLKNKADITKEYINDFNKLTMEIIDKKTQLVKKIFVYKGLNKKSGVDFIVWSSYDNETMIQTLRYSKGSIYIVEEYKDNKIISRKLYKNEEKEENFLASQEYDYERQIVLVKYVNFGNKLIVSELPMNIMLSPSINAIFYDYNSEKSKIIESFNFDCNIFSKILNFNFSSFCNLGLKVNATMTSLNVESSFDTLYKLNLTRNLKNTQFTYDYKIFNDLDEKKGIKNSYSGTIVFDKDITSLCFGLFKKKFTKITAECVNNKILTVYSIKQIDEKDYIIEETVYEGSTKETKIAKTYIYTSSIYLPKKLF